MPSSAFGRFTLSPDAQPDHARSIACPMPHAPTSFRCPSPLPTVAAGPANRLPPPIYGRFISLFSATPATKYLRACSAPSYRKIWASSVGMLWPRPSGRRLARLQEGVWIRSLTWRSWLARLVWNMMMSREYEIA